MKYSSQVLVTLLAIAVSGCGEKSTVNVKEPPPPALTGVFVDSPVEGLGYRSDSVESGSTNGAGEFSYFRGDQITFHIGDFAFPSVPASSILTPLDMFNADTPFNRSVVNTLRLLQALDTDGDPSNGITIGSDAAAAAEMLLAEGETVNDFFDQSEADFAADVEPWLSAAGSPSGQLADFDSAVEHFVSFLASEYGTLFANTFDVSQFNGTVYNPYLVGKDAVVGEFNFTPDDATGISGSYTQLTTDGEVTGTYAFAFGRRVLVLTSDLGTQYVTARSYNTVNQVYSLCVSNDAIGLASTVAGCDADDDARDNALTFSEAQTEAEVADMIERANTVEAALEEAFDTDTTTFFTSSYKRLTDDPNSSAMYYKTGGSPDINPTTGQLTLAGARFSIGNAADDPARSTTSGDTYSTGVFNISEGFTISFDVIDHNSSGSFNIYVDNNTTGQGNSVHGDASKFFGQSMTEEVLPIGQRFSYTYVPGADVTGLDPADPNARGVLNTSITNSFFQLRTDSSASITIDNLVIETVAEAVDPDDVFIPPEKIEFTDTVDFTQATDDTLFTPGFLAVIGGSGEAEDIPMLTRTGGSVTVAEGGIQLDGGRFTLGNYLPDTGTTGDDDSATGVLDLSKPYQIVLDIISVSDPEGDNTFDVFVDNNTTSSSSSLHGEASRVFRQNILDLDVGELVIPGTVGTDTSFLQFRTSSNGIVVFNNVRIEYIVEAPPVKVALPYEVDFTATTTELLFTPEFQAVDGEAGFSGEDTPMFTRTGGGVDITANGVQLDSGRFTLGNTTPDIETTGDDTSTSGVFDLSRPYVIKLDILSVSDAEGNNNFQIYVDNNTSSSSKSIHGGDSKFFQLPITEMVPGELVIDGFLASSTSFLQLRTESGGIVEFNNLRIEYADPNVFYEEGFPASEAEFFSADYRALPSDAAVAMYHKTGGTVELTESGGLRLDSGRFSIGNTTPDTDTTDGDTATTGVFDLSRPYKIVMDIVALDDSEGNNNFQIYVDNNTSSSSRSVHGGDSKFFQVQITEMSLGELEVEGFLATSTSFIQLRTESGGLVEIDNLRLEYLDTTGQDFSCSTEAELYFCDDFSDGSTANWQLLAQPEASSGPQGSFDILDDDGNNVLRYTAGGEGGEILMITEAAMANIPDTADYFVEARIRPRQNSTTRNKQLYLLGRYDSEGNWFGGGLNLQNSSSSTRVEVAVNTAGSISRPVQAATPLLLGAQDGTDGVWYRVRFEMIGSDLTVYLDGELMGSVSDSSFSAKGLIGIFTNNRSFEIDDIKVGDPSVKPVQLTLDFKEASWDATTTTDPLSIYVTATQDDGVTPDTFQVSSSDAGVVTAMVEDDVTVLLTPVGEGSATIYFVSGSDPTLSRTIEVTVEEGFTMSDATYGDISELVTPAVGANNAYVDTRLSITFDDAPVLGDVGEVRIYNAGDDSLVDVLTLGGDVDALGYAGQDRVRRVNYQPFTVDGNTLTIKPHSAALDYNTEYYVAIGESVVSGATLNGMTFTGMGKNAGWMFSTKGIAPSGTSFTVDDDGQADFRTLQGALNHVMENLGAETAATITVKAGEYEELLYLRNKHNLTIQGEDRANTVVYYDNYESFNGGTGGSEAPGNGTPGGGRSVFLVEGADMLVLNNFTLKNSHLRDNVNSNQAETIYFNSSDRLVANNMNFISEQDTLLLKGYSWFYNSLVAGNVDFIWGYATAALFEESEIRTIGDSKYGADTDSPGGYVLQARVQNADDPGFVFLNSNFTSGPGPLGNGVLDASTYIARSGGNGSYYDNITLINNKLGSHIATIGWAGNGVNGQPAPNPDPATAGMGWREYGSMDANGNALDLSGRESAYLLEAGDVTDYQSRDAVFAGYASGTGWSPTPLDAPEITETSNDPGFAGYNYDITGGAGGMTVTVDNGLDLIAALDEAADANMPVTVYVDGTITDANSGGSGQSINIKDMDNVSIIGVGTRGEFDGIGISIRRANNIIIQNLSIHHVLTGGKDAISIEGDDDGSTTSHIWIDHNELYSTLSVDKDYYDGLIDSKSGATHITISYNYLHDHWKASLHGHTEDAETVNTDRYITFHHNRFENIESRLPLFRRGYGHLYNNYFKDINSTAINSRIGAELQVENNVFEDTQNPVVSFYSDVIGYWNTSGNLLDNVSWTSPSGTDVIADDDMTPTSSYTVPYEYTLDDASEVKAKVINQSGVGKIDQSGLDIPPIEDDGEDNEPQTVSLPYSLDLTAADSDAFFSSDFQAIPGQGSVPMYSKTGGTVTVLDGSLTLDSGRFTIGNGSPDTDSAEGDTASTGVLDLSKPYQIILNVTALSDSEGNNNFQIYVDNNTSSSSKSMHGGDSKFYQVQITEMTTGELTIEGFTATDSSYLQLRTESGGVVTIDSLRIEYLASDAIVSESFDDADADFFSAGYKALPEDDVTPMYVKTGGTVELFEGGLRLDSGRFTIGQTAPDTETSDADVSANGALDLSQPYRIVLDIVSLTDEEGNNNLQVYVDNNTTSSSKSMHGGDSKFYQTQITELAVGELVIEGFVATENSFLQLRTESGGIVVIDNLTIEYIE